MAEDISVTSVLEFLLKGSENFAKFNESILKTGENAKKAKEQAESDKEENPAKKNAERFAAAAKIEVEASLLKRKAAANAAVAAAAAETAARAYRRTADAEEATAAKLDAAAQRKRKAADNAMIAAKRAKLSAQDAVEASDKWQKASVQVEESATKLTETSEHLANISRGMLAWSARLQNISSTIVKSFTEVAEKGLDFEGSLQDLSEKTGISTENLSKLRFAAQSLEVPMDAVVRSVGYLDRSLDRANHGGVETERVFRRLGLSTRGLMQEGVYERVGSVAEALKNVQDPGTRSALAMQIFGRGAQDIVPLLQEGKEGIEEFGKKAEELGLVVGTEAAEAAKKAQDQLQEMGQALQGVGAAIAEGLLPIIRPMIESLEHIARGVANFARHHATLMKFIAAVVLGAGALIFLGSVLASTISFATGLGSALTFLAAAAEVAEGGGTFTAMALAAMGISATGATAPVAGMGTALWTALAPVLPIIAAILLGIAAVAVAGYLIYKNWDKVQDVFAGLGVVLAPVKKLFGDIWEAIEPLISAIGQLLLFLGKIALFLNPLFLLARGLAAIGHRAREADKAAHPEHEEGSKEAAIGPNDGPRGAQFMGHIMVHSDGKVGKEAIQEGMRQFGRSMEGANVSLG